MSLVPHHGQGIEPTIQRPDLIDPAVVRLRIERRTHIPFAGRMAVDIDLAPSVIAERGGQQPMTDGGPNLVVGEIGSQETIGIGEATADVTGETDLARHVVPDSFNLNQFVGPRFHAG
jgi:hypothetical protein